MPVTLQREEIVQRLAPLFASTSWVRLAYLFGSFARGWARPWSDVDIGLVLSESAPEPEERVVPLARLETRLAAALDGAPMDLVILNGQGPVFQHSVLETGVCLYEASRRERALFESRVLAEYDDFLPTLRWFQRFHEEGVRRRLDRR